MTDKVKADYEALSDAANRFSQESDRIKQIASRLGHGAENLKRTSWTGKGAEAFFKEMEGSVLPTYRRLSDALKEASTILKALSKLFQDAEQEASGFVKGTGGGSAGGAGADGGEGAGTAGGAIGDAVAAAMGAAFGGAAGGAFGGAGAGDDSGAGGAAGAGDMSGTGGAGGDGGGQDDLESFPSTLQEALQNALGGAGLKPSGNIIEIVLQKGKGMADTGQQYGADQSGAGGGGPSGAGDAGAGAALPTAPQETPSSGGGGGGSPDSGFGGGGGQGGGASMVEGGAVGTPMGAGQAFWFGATPGSRLSSPVVAAGGGSVPAGVPAGGDALGLLASFGATAGAAVLGIVGKTAMGKGLKP